MSNRPVRVYVNDPATAQREVRKIYELLDNKLSQDLLSYDIETIPAPGLDAYPKTLGPYLDTEEPEKGKKKRKIRVSPTHYKMWLVMAIHLFFDVENFPVEIPEKFTNQSKLAKRQWEYLLSEVINNPAKFEALMLPGAALDFRYFLHVAHMVRDNRPPKKDPVAPGLHAEDTQVFLVQFSVRVDGRIYSWVFNALKTGVDVFKPLYRRQKTLWLGQNIKFDLRHTEHRTGYSPENIWDTAVADKLLTLGIRTGHDLHSIAKRVVKVELDKEVRNTFVGITREEPTPAQLNYSFLDTEILFPIYDRQVKLAQGVRQFDVIKTYCDLSPIVAHQELDGFAIDREKWLELTKIAGHLRDVAANKLEALLLGKEYINTFGMSLPGDDDFPEDSSENDWEIPDEDEDSGGDDDAVPGDNRANAVIKISQTALVSKLLEPLLNIDRERLDKSLIGKKGDLSLGKAARNTLEYIYTKDNGHTHEFFGLYAEWSEMAKIVSSYGAKFVWHIHPITQKLHPGFNICGTETSRFSSSAPSFLTFPRGREDGTGVDVRSAILSMLPADWARFFALGGLVEQLLVIGGADYATFEARAAAEASQDPAYMEIFKRGLDMHSASAVLAFHTERAHDDTILEPLFEEAERRVGSQMMVIKLYRIPDNWSIKQWLDFALTEQCMSLVIKPTRQLAKIVNFLRLFGGGATALAAKVNITVEQAKEVLETLSVPFPKLGAAIEAAGEKPFEAANQFVSEAFGQVGFVRVTGGLRRYFRIPRPPRKVFRRDFEYNTAGNEAWEKAKEEYADAGRLYFRSLSAIRRRGFNAKCQVLNAHVTAEAMVLIHRRGKPHGIRVWLSVYDQVLVLMPANTKPSIYKWVVEDSMVEAAERYIHSVPVVVELDPPSPRMQKNFSKAEKKAWEKAMETDTPWHTGLLELEVASV